MTAGHVLGRLDPRLSGGDDRATLASGVAEAQAAADGAHADLTRAEGLLAERAVPARRHSGAGGENPGPRIRFDRRKSTLL